MSVNLPRVDSRTTVVGSTGSGKTVFSTWLLYTRDIERRPWIIIDFKGDDLLNSLGATRIRLPNIPKEPGLYIANPLPGEEDLVSLLFHNAWKRENVGILVDEGTMIQKQDKWFRACLTQGRSKHVEMIICSQRPLWLDKYVFTESTFFSVHNINYLDDRKHLAAYLDGKVPQRLVDHQSIWYDVAEQRLSKLGPVPAPDELRAMFRKRLEKRPVIL